MPGRCAKVTSHVDGKRVEILESAITVGLMDAETSAGISIAPPENRKEHYRVMDYDVWCSSF